MAESNTNENTGESYVFKMTPEFKAKLEAEVENLRLVKGDEYAEGYRAGFIHCHALYAITFDKFIRNHGALIAENMKLKENQHYEGIN